MKTIIQRINLRLGYATYPRFPRGSVGYAIKHFKGKSITCAEVGVCEGENAVNMLKTLNIRKIYLVDPYNKNVGYQTFPNLPSLKSVARKKLRKYLDKIFFMYIYSEEASKVMKSEGFKLDFVYIDGNHEYKEVKKDIKMWYPLVKKGGIISGHDIIEHPEVSKAVSEFCYENKINPHFIGEDWIIVK